MWLSYPHLRDFAALKFAMDRFEKRRFLPPIELMIVLAINVVVGVLVYYSFLMWGFARG